jgi:uncharacterized membrane protein
MPPGPTFVSTGSPFIRSADRFPTDLARERTRRTGNSVTRWLVLGLVVAVGVALFIAWGWVAALFYTLLAVVAAVVSWGAGIANQVTREISRGRFADRER